MSQQKNRCIFAKIIILLHLPLSLLVKCVRKRLNLDNCNDFIAFDDYAIKPTALIAIFKIGMKANRMALMIKFRLQICLASILGLYKSHIVYSKEFLKTVKINIMLRFLIFA